LILLSLTLPLKHKLSLFVLQGRFVPLSHINFETQQIENLGLVLHLSKISFPFMLDRRCPHLAHTQSFSAQHIQNNSRHWNVRGLNATNKWSAIRSKVKESNCDIICHQETKREFFYQKYLRNFCPPQLDNFDFIPSQGLSRGTIVIWKGARFLDHTISESWSKNIWKGY
jgi:hypothetical protein